MKIVSNGRDTRLSYGAGALADESWTTRSAALRDLVSAVRDANRADEPLRIALPLSSTALGELERPAALERFRDWLDTERCRVHTIDDVPSEPCIGKPMSCRDARSERTGLDRTCRLATLLATLTPPDGHGSLALRPASLTTRTDAAREAAIAENLLHAVAHCVRLERDRGVRIALAIEPEPWTPFGTSGETVHFFERHLLTMAGVRRIAALAGLPAHAARQALLRHLGICHDVRHAALHFESSLQALERYAAAGIEVVKLRLGSALRIGRVNEAALRHLSRFAGLSRPHPVLERCGDTLTRYARLDAAIDAARYRLERRSTLDARLQVALLQAMTSSAGAAAVWQPIEEPPTEWRVRLDVPVFLASVGMLSTIRDELVTVLARQRASGFCKDLQIEPCTPIRLPAEPRDGQLAGVIARELDWVRAHL